MSSEPRSVPWARRLVASLTPVVIIMLGLLVGSVVITASGESPVVAFRELFLGIFRDMDSITAVLLRATPIIITGVGVSISIRAGIHNLGGAGQMILGGVAAAAIGMSLSLPVVTLPVLLLGAAVVGAVVAAVPAFLEARYKVPILVVTLLMNYIVALLVEYLVNYPLHNSQVVGLAAETVPVTAQARLLRLIPGTRLHFGLLIAAVLVMVVKFFFDRTPTGYELRMSGLNPLFAEYSGLNRERGIMVSMCLAGAVAGLAGAVEVAGVHGRYVVGIMDKYTWIGLTAALLGRGQPVSVAIGGLLLAALQTGAIAVQRTTRVPVQMADIVQASIMFFVASRLGIQLWLERVAKRRFSDAS